MAAPARAFEERSRPETLPRVLALSPGFDAAGDARVLPRAPGKGPRCGPPGALGLCHAEPEAGAILRRPRRGGIGDSPREIAGRLRARTVPHARRDLESDRQRDHDVTGRARR